MGFMAACASSTPSRTAPVAPLLSPLQLEDGTDRQIRDAKAVCVSVFVDAWENAELGDRLARSVAQRLARPVARCGAGLDGLRAEFESRRVAWHSGTTVVNGGRIVAVSDGVSTALGTWQDGRDTPVRDSAERFGAALAYSLRGLLPRP